MPTNNVQVSLTIEDYDDSFKTKFPLELKFIDLRETIDEKISITFQLTSSALIGILQYYFTESMYFKMDLHKRSNINVNLSASNANNIIYLENLSVENKDKEKIELDVSELNITKVDKMHLIKVEKLTLQNMGDNKIYIGELNVSNSKNPINVEGKEEEEEEELHIEAYSDVEFGTIIGN